MHERKIKHLIVNLNAMCEKIILKWLGTLHGKTLGGGNNTCEGKMRKRFWKQVPKFSSVLFQTTNWSGPHNRVWFIENTILKSYIDQKGSLVKTRSSVKTSLWQRQGPLSRQGLWSRQGSQSRVGPPVKKK